MIISEVQLKIDSLELALPRSFTFVLDTTDRTFIYKSVDRKECVDKVLELDRVECIDRLMKDIDFFEWAEGQAILFLRKLSQNTFLGICSHLDEYDSNQLNKAKSIINN